MRLMVLNYIVCLLILCLGCQSTISQILKTLKLSEAILEDCGDLAREYGQRITFHPGPFDVLASKNENVVSQIYC